jgi:hypothetical protein
VSLGASSHHIVPGPTDQLTRSSHSWTKLPHWKWSGSHLDRIRSGIYHQNAIQISEGKLKVFHSQH